MPQLIRNRRLVADDPWAVTTEEGTPSPRAHQILPFEQYQVHREQLCENVDGPLGALVDGAVEAETLAPYLDELALVAIDFPSFTDGRGYSLARQLRQAHGYTGELRAVGNVLRDQLAYLERVGFDSFLLEAGRDADDALRAFEEFSAYYQNAPADQLPLLRRRELVRAA